MSDRHGEMVFRELLQDCTRGKHTRRFWKHHDKDGYQCPMCGFEHRDKPSEFDVHHIDGDWLNGHIFNLVAICHRCHVRYHKLKSRHESLEEWKSRAESIIAADA